MNEETNYTLVNDITSECLEVFLWSENREDQKFPMTPNESVIYAIVNKENNKKYVGSAINMRKRIRVHINDLKRVRHHSTALQNACNKYGINAFKFIILEKVPEKENLVPREQYWIDTLKPEYNISPTAGSSLGIKRSDETKRKLSERHMGVKHSEERRKQKSLYQKGVKRKGNSLEGRLNQSLAQKKLYDSGYKSPRCKVVYQYNLEGVFIKEWESVTLAAIDLGVNHETIAGCARGKRKTGAKFRWSFEYKEYLDPFK